MGECLIVRRGGEYGSALPEYTYSGSAVLIDDGDDNWRIKFLTSGKLRFNYLGNARKGIDVFLLGGGGGGGYTTAKYGGSGGGAGGYTATYKTQIQPNVEYDIVVGAGGSGGGNGGKSEAFGFSANGGNCGRGSHLESGGGWGGRGGDGGSGGGAGQYGKVGYAGSGGSDGGNGGYGSTNIETDSSNYRGGYGQGTTTREFGEASGTLYAGGGGGGCGQYQGYGSAGSGGAGGGAAGEQSQTGVKNASANTGGGGGGVTGIIGASSGTGGRGGSGIVIIRNVR